MVHTRVKEGERPDLALTPHQLPMVTQQDYTREQLEAQFALNALMEIPEQFKVGQQIPRERGGGRGSVPIHHASMLLARACTAMQCTAKQCTAKQCTAMQCP